MLPNGGNLPPLSMADINSPSGFNGRGNNLNAYRGTLFYRPDNSTGYFTSGAINFTDFYSTQGSSPVVPGNSGNVSSGSSIQLPSLFNKLYVTCYGGSGGGGQGAKGVGYASTYGGNAGGNGSATTFMGGTAFAVSADFGGGGGGGGQSSGNIYGRTSDGTGATGPSGTGAGGLAGGAGGGGAGTFWSGLYYTEGAGGGGGGAGGKTGPILVMDIDAMGWSNIRNYYNAVVGISLGAGGGGGGGATGGGNNGTGGSSGIIYISWT